MIKIKGRNLIELLWKFRGKHLCRSISIADYIFAKTAYINLMQRIFDNIDLQLLPALKETLQLANRADFCVGYFNLRGWKQLDSYIGKWSGGQGNCCRLLSKCSIIKTYGEKRV